MPEEAIMKIYDVEFWESGDDPYMAGWRSGWLYLDRQSAEEAMLARVEREKKCSIWRANIAETEPEQKYWLRAADQIVDQYRVTERTTEN